jgi:hypothetical protein
VLHATLGLRGDCDGLMRHGVKLVNLVMLCRMHAPQYNCANLTSLTSRNQRELCMLAWQLQEAESRFSEVVDLSLTEGPQLITRRGQ